MANSEHLSLKASYLQLTAILSEADLPSLAGRLMEQKLISSATYQRIITQSSAHTRATTILQFVLEKVKQDPKHFDTFLRILTEYPALQMEAVSLNEKQRELQRAAVSTGCSCVKNQVMYEECVSAALNTKNNLDTPLNFKDLQVAEFLAENKDILTYRTLLRSCIEADKLEVAKKLIEIFAKTADHHQEEPSSRPAPIVKRAYLGHSIPNEGDLAYVKNYATREKFRLTEKLAPYWKEVGRTLGLGADLLECIDMEERRNVHRLDRVLMSWMSNASGLPNHEQYPLSWQGLSNLITDIGHRNLAQKYFDFLEKVDSHS